MQQQAPARTRFALFTLILSLAIAIAWHLLGMSLFEGSWSARHWSVVSVWYLLGWAVVSGGLIFVALRYTTHIERCASSRPAVLTSAVALLLLTILFGYDSFVYGAGNLRVAQIAQADPIVHRWYEFGSTLIVTIFYRIASIWDMKDTSTAVLAWRLYAYLATALSLWASVRLAALISESNPARVFVFAILFAGPQLLAMMGLIAIEPGLVAAFLWQAVSIYRLTQRHSPSHLLALWAVTIAGVALHWTGIVLVPPALLMSLSRQSRLQLSAAGIANLALVATIVAIYLRAVSDFEFSQFVLMLDGYNPMADYALLSSRHITDLLQLLLITFPGVLLLKLLWWRRPPSSKDRFTWAITLQAMGGLAMLLILNPREGMPFDLPLLVAYLTPMAILLATLLGQISTTTITDRTAVALGGLSCVIMIGSILPAYVDIHNADQYLRPYLNRHNALFMSGSFAFRDAYFERGELDKANAWEWDVPLRSLAYMHMEGASRLVENQKYSEGLRSLYQIKTEHPYWAEPRALIATTLMSLGRPGQARPEIDTTLMLQPYRQEFHINRYTAMRQQRHHDSALIFIEKALDIWPDEPSIRVDYMYGLYHTGQIERAIMAADSLLAEDSRTAHAYALKGMVAEQSGHLAQAARFYQQFLEMAPLDPDAEAVRRRLDRIKSRL